MTRARAAQVVALSLLWLQPPVAVAPPGGVEEAEGASFPRVEVHGVASARVVAASDVVSWLDGGLGKHRYGGRDADGNGSGDEETVGFEPSQLSLVVVGRASETLRGHLHLNFDTDLERDNAIDQVGVVEAFAGWNPVLGERSRLRLRAGIFIPPYSLEHPEIGWSTRYTITPSAIGSWLGEEVKATGVEATFVLEFGTGGELQLQGGLFGGNDSTGVLLSWRGWALHDRQGMTWDELPLPPVLSLTDPRFFTRQGLTTDPFREIDGRPGWYGQGRVRINPNVMLQGGWYDNNGDVTQVDPDAYTWHTRFAIAGAQIDAGPFTLIGQYLDGQLDMGFKAPALVDNPVRAGFAMASLTPFASTRVTARYDRWEVEDEDPWQEGKDLNDDEGWAGTLAFIQAFGRHVRLELEYIHSWTRHPFAVTAGEQPEFEQNQFSLGGRLTY